MGRLGDTPLPLGFDEREFAWRLPGGGDGSPSGPKIQARSAVYGKKSSSTLSILAITVRWKLAANRYHTIFPLGSISMVRCFSSRAAPGIVRRSLLPRMKQRAAFGIRSAIVCSPVFGGSMPPPLCPIMSTLCSGFRLKRIWSNVSGTGNGGQHAHMDSIGSGIFLNIDCDTTKVSKTKHSMFSKIPSAPD